MKTAIVGGMKMIYPEPFFKKSRGGNHVWLKLNVWVCLFVGDCTRFGGF